MQPFRFGFGELDQQDRLTAESHAAVTLAAHPVQPLLALTAEVREACTPECFMPAQEAGHPLTLYKVQIDSADAALKLGVSDVNISDLVPGMYEGGFKLWEGGRDLTQVVCSQWHWGTGIRLLPQVLKGRHVLELGCGHGLPGIACLLAGAEVLFHDLNMSVLAHATAPNVMKNTENYEELRSQAQFVDGDFQSAAKVIWSTYGVRSFDLVLTAESIYNSTSAKQLLEACDMCLSKHGSVLLAAKSYYFGVGGSIAMFKKQVETDGRFSWLVLKRIDDGTNNVREVLLLSRSAEE